MRIASAILALTTLGNAAAATPGLILADLEAEATRAGEPATQASVAHGRALFTATGRDFGCASCHTPDARRAGRHAVTGRTIAPLAPVANPERFTDRARVDKWFRRNCGDVFGRECSARERADILRYLLSLPATGSAA